MGGCHGDTEARRTSVKEVSSTRSSEPRCLRGFSKGGRRVGAPAISKERAHLHFEIGLRLNPALTDIQHDHHEVFLSTLHVHLDHHNCLEVLAVRGKASLVKRSLDKDEAQKLLAVARNELERAKALGYATGQFGKNHLGDRDHHLPTKHGFDEFFGNLYHLNAEEEPENRDYPRDMIFMSTWGLENYRKEWDEKLSTWKATARHDEFSHGYKSFETAAVGSRRPPAVQKIAYSNRGIV